MFLVVVQAGRQAGSHVEHLEQLCFHVSPLQCAVVLAGGLADCLLN